MTESSNSEASERTTTFVSERNESPPNIHLEGDPDETPGSASSASMQHVGGRYTKVTAPSPKSYFIVLLKKNLLLAWRNLRVFSIVGALLLTCAALLGAFQYPVHKYPTSAQDLESHVRYALGMQKTMILVAPLCICFSQVSSLHSLVGEMVLDKHSKMKMAQLVSGVPVWVYWSSYIAYYVIVSVVMGIAFTIILKWTCMTKSSWMLIGLAIEVGFVQMLAISVILVTICGKPHVAAAVIGLILLSTIFSPINGYMTFIGAVQPMLQSEFAHFVAGAFLPAFSLGNLIQGVVRLEYGGYNTTQELNSSITSRGYNQSLKAFIPGQGWHLATFFEIPRYPPTDHMIKVNKTSRSFILGEGRYLASFFTNSGYMPTDYARNIHDYRYLEDSLIDILNHCENGDEHIRACEVYGPSATPHLIPSAGSSLVALSIQAAILLAFSVYLALVWQTGSLKPNCSDFYFDRKRRWLCGRGVAGDEENLPDQALEIIRLFKEFHDERMNPKIALNGLSLTVQRGDVYALLGHNGAGKTTLLSCIAGTMPATEGDITVLGHSVTEEREQARWNLAVCTQDTPMFNNLKWKRHLRFFGELRARDIDTIDGDIWDYVVWLGLNDVKDKKCKYLSGSQRRRLCVATSLLGSAPVALLDEPSSGMDPISRQRFWWLTKLMKEKGRTIVFTTHHLEEADLLASHKAILSAGEKEAEGTSKELKRHFKSGYTLVIQAYKGAVEEVKDMVQSVVGLDPPSESPSCDLVTLSFGLDSTRCLTPYRDNETLSFNAPFSDTTVGIFTKLDEAKENEQILDYELKMLSFEEAYMKFEKQEIECGRRLQQQNIPNSTIRPGSAAGISQRNIEGSIGSTPMNRGSLPGRPRASSAESRSPGASDIPCVPENEEVEGRLLVTWSEAVLAVAWLRYRHYAQRCKVFVGMTILPILLMLLLFLVSASFQVTGKTTGQAMAGVAAFYPGIGLGVLMVVFAETLATERLSSIKHAIISQGLPPSAYWMGTLLVHYCNALVISLSVPLLSILTSQDYLTERTYHCPMGDIMSQQDCTVTSTSHLRALSAFLAAMVSPLPLILGAYHVSQLAETSEAALRIVAMNSIVLGGIPAMFVNMWQALLHAPRFAWWSHVIFSLFLPPYSLPGTMIGLWMLCDHDDIPGGMHLNDHDHRCFRNYWGYLTGAEVFLPLLGAVWLTVALTYWLLCREWQCCRGCARFSRAPVQDEESQHSSIDEDVQQEATHSLQVRDEDSVACLCKEVYHTYPKDMKALHNISLRVHWGECFGLLGPNGAGKTTLLGLFTGQVPAPTKGNVFVSGRAMDSKDRFAAYRSMGNSPQVDPIIGWLTGDEHLKLYAWIRGFRDPSKVLAEQQRIIHLVSLTYEEVRKPCERLSRGEKRKLCLGLALIGGPPVVFLDEPTTAVDPWSKKHLWAAIRKRSRPTQTVVLSSLSMEEVEALSDRLAIMVVGKIRCLGSPMHIKNRFGSGYQLEIFLKKPSRDEARGSGTHTPDSHSTRSSRTGLSTFSFGSLGSLEERLLTEFVKKELSKNAELLDCHRGRFTYNLPLQERQESMPSSSSLQPSSTRVVKLGEIIKKLQNQRVDEYQIRDFSLLQPSLNQIFITFAREQLRADISREQPREDNAPPDVGNGGNRWGIAAILWNRNAAMSAG